ncbi:MAG TPA: CYTH domain-containing protein [Burkholderiales bacterium]|jgi:inorganic triphosphatase YgiF|nr:CYTH domain-containing protein [Burkholderiales bacterium]
MIESHQEVEIKLKCPRNKVEAFLEHPMLHALDGHARPERHRMINIYYDTPDLLLRQSKVALRLRRIDNTWVQTLKAPGKRQGGLSSRKEWEMPVKGEALELELFKGSDADLVIEALRKHGLESSLVPQFRVDFQRLQWMLRPFPRTQPMFRSEVVLDRGEIVANGHREPVSEVEIELKHGHIKELRRVAAMLMRDVGLTEETSSKARRGYALLAEQK